MEREMNSTKTPWLNSCLVSWKPFITDRDRKWHRPDEDYDNRTLVVWRAQTFSASKWWEKKKRMKWLHIMPLGAWLSAGVGSGLVSTVWSRALCFSEWPGLTTDGFPVRTLSGFDPALIAADHSGSDGIGNHSRPLTGLHRDRPRWETCNVFLCFNQASSG